MSEAPNVPTTDTAGHIMGHGTLKPPGRGLQNGVPYGEQLEDERADVARTWKFSPGVAGRLRAATRSALRRG